MRRWIPYLSIAVLAGAVIAGLFVLDSPQTAREKRLDEQYLRALGRLAREVASFRAGEGRWPVKMGEVVGGTSREGVVLETLAGADWTYGIRQSDARLCLSPLRPDHLPAWASPIGSDRKGAVTVAFREMNSGDWCYLMRATGDGAEDD